MEIKELITLTNALRKLDSANKEYYDAVEKVLLKYYDIVIETCTEHYGDCGVCLDNINAIINR